MKMLQWAFRVPTYFAFLAVFVGSISPSTAQNVQVDTGEGAHIRLGGDITIADGQSSNFVLVVDGSANIAGTADVVVVIDGEARRHPNSLWVRSGPFVGLR